ncbi:efflux RND transporter periplasmic adaptor subunit [Paracoccus limosus]|jgi:RND family efflux transporter MFP subunit|uniref:Efflux RND transporter periplasmic adaptor subunit n=1 Tax=Paracoccus limosus TaxID=913252 RepID=A0A844H8T2_9RHOB|nr:efflux RND transporter periplasmic adaptor subunit [Paracoccus limosus]MTH36545.1 efflux RND transporter periplasmic adaptor subunit [Paracoccus limosus]
MLRLALILSLVTFSSRSVLAEDALAVEFVTVRETPLIYDVALTGTIHAVDTVEVGFRQGGRVVEVLVNEGDTVKSGQPLARTDPLQQEQAFRIAEAAVAAATAARDQAQQAMDRAQAMLERGVGTRADLDSAAQALSSAEGGLTQAAAQLDQARRALDDTVILAPTDAVVTARQVEPGQIVGAAQSVITLASSSGREAVFQTTDSPLLRHAIDAPVSLRGIDMPNLAMTAKISEIAPLVDPATGSVTVRARIDNPPPGLDLLGSPVQGAVHFPAGKGIAVPWTALTATGAQPAVWTVDAESRALLVAVRIERFANGTVILAGGISPGQVVVGAGSQLLYPGRKLRRANGAQEARP